VAVAAVTVAITVSRQRLGVVDGGRIGSGAPTETASDATVPTTDVGAVPVSPDLASPATLPADAPRAEMHAIEAGPADAPEISATKAEPEPVEGPPPADEVPPPSPPDEASQTAAAQARDLQALPVSPPDPPAAVPRAAPVSADRPARARTAEESTIHAIRRLLDRYATELASREYVGAVRDVDVRVQLLSIREEGDRSVVRFTLRDRYRDATGQLVLRETPPLETVVVKTTGGVRFETPPA